MLGVYTLIVVCNYSEKYMLLVRNPPAKMGDALGMVVAHAFNLSTLKTHTSVSL